jgi:hypothetical protein
LFALRVAFDFRDFSSSSKIVATKFHTGNKIPFSEKISSQHLKERDPTLGKRDREDFG